MEKILLSIASLIIGAYLGYIKFKLSYKKVSLEGIKFFLELKDKYNSDIRFLYSYNYPLSVEKISKEDFLRLENVINYLNTVAILSENNILPKKYLLMITHTQFIRLTYKLKPFIKQKEKMLGSRYGRKILEFYKLSIRYHILNPKHRRTDIFIYDDKYKKKKIYDNRKICLLFTYNKAFAKKIKFICCKNKFFDFYFYIWYKFII